MVFKITDYGREVADQAKEARPELHHLMKRFPVVDPLLAR